MNNIFKAIFSFLTGIVLVVFPHKPSNLPKKIVPTVQISPIATPSGTVKGISTESKKASVFKDTQTQQITSTPHPTLVPIVIPTSVPVVQRPIIYVAPSTKKDYSSYLSSLYSTQNSLQSRLASVQSQANNVPQETNDAIAIIDSTISSLKTSETAEINNQTIITANELGKRGIDTSRGLGAQEIERAVSPIRDKYASMYSELDYRRNQVVEDAKNKLNNFKSQEENLGSKLDIVQGVIDRITSGGFTDSDIPIALQAINY